MLLLWVPCLRSRRHARLSEKTWLRQRSHGTRPVSFLAAECQRSRETSPRLLRSLRLRTDLSAGITKADAIISGRNRPPWQARGQISPRWPIRLRSGKALRPPVERSRRKPSVCGRDDNKRTSGLRAKRQVKPSGRSGSCCKELLLRRDLPSPFPRLPPCFCLFRRVPRRFYHGGQPARSMRTDGGRHRQATIMEQGHGTEPG
jgi:hypothetical protein